MASAVSCSVVIPTRNRASALQRVLGALRGQELAGPEPEVVVVDNGSSPDVRSEIDRALEAFPWPTILVDVPEPNISAARNAGVEAASGALIVFTNDDVIPARMNWLAGHVGAHEASDGALVAVLGPVEWAPEIEPTAVMRWLTITGKGHDYDGLHEGKRRPSAFYANNLSLPRRAFLDVGGFDERLGSYGWEEYDLSLRLHDRGLRVVWRPDLLGHHLHRYGLRDSLRRMEQIGRSTAVFHRIHDRRDDLATPQPSRWKMTLGRASAPVALRLALPEHLPDQLAHPLFRWAHQAALVHGMSAERHEEHAR